MGYRDNGSRCVFYGEGEDGKKITFETSLKEKERFIKTKRKTNYRFRVPDCRTCVVHFGDNRGQGRVIETFGNFHRFIGIHASDVGNSLCNSADNIIHWIVFRGWRGKLNFLVENNAGTDVSDLKVRKKTTLRFIFCTRDRCRVRHNT